MSDFNRQIRILPSIAATRQSVSRSEALNGVVRRTMDGHLFLTDNGTLIVDVTLDDASISTLHFEELAEQIDKYQLELWESSELISGVWTRLYKMYKQGGDSSDADRAGKLYERLARLDPCT